MKLLQTTEISILNVEYVTLTLLIFLRE